MAFSAADVHVMVSAIVENWGDRFEKAINEQVKGSMAAEKYFPEVANSILKSPGEAYRLGLLEALQLFEKTGADALFEEAARLIKAAKEAL